MGQRETTPLLIHWRKEAFLFFPLYVYLWFFNAELGAGNTGGAQSFFGGATDGLPVREW